MFRHCRLHNEEISLEYAQNLGVPKLQEVRSGNETRFLEATPNVRKQALQKTAWPQNVKMDRDFRSERRH